MTIPGKGKKSWKTKKRKRKTLLAGGGVIDGVKSRKRVSPTRKRGEE